LQPSIDVGAVLGFLLALATTTSPHATVKVPIYLQASADDEVGAMYVSKLRDALESSSDYKRVSTVTDAKFVIAIVTMDPNEAELGFGAGHSTVAAVTLQLQNSTGLNYIVYSWVLVANRGKVDSLATDLFAAIDTQIQELTSPRPSPSRVPDSKRPGS
jgi:hypothetical protein